MAAHTVINHDILLNKMTGMEIPAHLVRWMFAFLLDREQSENRRRCVKTRVSQWGHLLTTALYLKYATKTWYLLSRILLTYDPVIMTCVSIRLRPKRWLYVSEETKHL